MRTRSICEVLYELNRTSGRQEALNAIADRASAGVITDASLAKDIWLAAGTLKANLRRVSLADCFAIELSRRLQGEILTAAQHEFDVLATDGAYRIRFIR